MRASDCAGPLKLMWPARKDDLAVQRTSRCLLRAKADIEPDDPSLIFENHCRPATPVENIIEMKGRLASSIEGLFRIEPVAIATRRLPDDYRPAAIALRLPASAPTMYLTVSSILISPIARSATHSPLRSTITRSQTVKMS